MSDKIQQLLEWKAAQPKFKEAEEAAKVALMQEMKDNQSISVGNKKGDGYISLVTGEPYATVEDAVQLEQFCVAEGDHSTQVRIVDHQAAVAVLRQHAPHLLEESDVAPQWAINAALKRAENGENIPGVLVRQKPSYLSVRPTAACKERVQAGLLSSGLPQLGGGE